MNSHQNTASISPTRSRVLRIGNAFFYLLVISLVLQMAGCFSPGWLYLEHDGFRVHCGIWFVLLCSDIGPCKTVTTANVNVVAGRSIPSVFGLSSVVTSSSLSEYRGETTSALIFCMAAIVVLYISRRRLNIPNSNHVMVPLVIGGVATVLTGVLALTAACQVGDETRRKANLMTSEGSPNPFKFPYALFLTGFGGFLSLIAFLVFLIGKPWELSAENQTPSPQEPPQTAMHPAQFTAVETAYPPQGPPQMYAVPSAPPLPLDYDEAHAASLYY